MYILGTYIATAHSESRVHTPRTRQDEDIVFAAEYAVLQK